MIQEGNSTIRYHTIALTRAFKVKAGETTIYLFCKETAVAYSVGITRQVLTAHFVPNAYGPTESD
jgi:hypothetical protein